MEKTLDNYIIDSNVWIGMFNTTDSLHAKSIVAMQQLEQKNKKYIVSNFIIQELFTILSLRASQTKAHDSFMCIQNTQRIFSIDIDKEWLPDIVQFIQKNNLSAKLSLTDASILFLAKVFNFSILSFDELLGKAAQNLDIKTMPKVTEYSTVLS